MNESELDDLKNGVQRRADRLGIDERQEFIREPVIAGICRDCCNATIMKRKASNDVHVFCDALSVRYDFLIPTDLEFCTSYYKKGQVSIRTMVEQAYIIDPHANEKVGFKLRKYEDEEEKKA